MTPTTCRLSLLLLLGLAATAVAQEHLPTPFTAEEIRDAWRPGRTVTMSIESAAGETISRTTVIGWSPERVEYSEQRLDPERGAVGEAVTSSAGWEELQGHARFRADLASRERLRTETPLGELDGWLYRVSDGAGASQELFFADAYPGPPVVFSGTAEGEVTFRARQIENLPPTVDR
jgi:hypothetical protein